MLNAPLVEWSKTLHLRCTPYYMGEGSNPSGRRMLERAVVLFYFFVYEFTSKTVLLYFFVYEITSKTLFVILGACYATYLRVH